MAEDLLHRGLAHVDDRQPFFVPGLDFLWSLDQQARVASHWTALSRALAWRGSAPSHRGMAHLTLDHLTEQVQHALTDWGWQLAPQGGRAL